MDRVKISGLSSLIRVLSPVIRFAARVALERNASKLTPAERAAVEVLLAAAQGLEALLPIPGDDNDPRTQA